MVVSESSRRTEQASSSQPRDTSHSKEFDPYSSQKSVEEISASKVMSSFGMSGNSLRNISSYTFHCKTISFQGNVDDSKVLRMLFNYANNYEINCAMTIPKN